VAGGFGEAAGFGAGEWVLRGHADPWFEIGELGFFSLFPRRRKSFTTAKLVNRSSTTKLVNDELFSACIDGNHRCP